MKGFDLNKCTLLGVNNCYSGEAGTMQFTKPEASEMQIQRVPWQGSSTIQYLSMGWVHCKAFPCGGRKNPKKSSQKAIPLRCTEDTQVTTSRTKSSLVVVWTRPASHRSHERKDSTQRTWQHIILIWTRFGRSRLVTWLRQSSLTSHLTCCNSVIMGKAKPWSAYGFYACEARL